MPQTRAGTASATKGNKRAASKPSSAKPVSSKADKTTAAETLHALKEAYGKQWPNKSEKELNALVRKALAEGNKSDHKEKDRQQGGVTVKKI